MTCPPTPVEAAGLGILGERSGVPEAAGRRPDPVAGVGGTPVEDSGAPEAGGPWVGAVEVGSVAALSSVTTGPVGLGCSSAATSDADLPLAASSTMAVSAGPDRGSAEGIPSVAAASAAGVSRVVSVDPVSPSEDEAATLGSSSSEGAISTCSDCASASVVGSASGLVALTRFRAFLRLVTGEPADLTADLTIFAYPAPEARLSFSSLARTLLATPGPSASDPVGTGSFTDLR
ncbi:MAG: hypothetical protein J4G12_05530 [Gemmatimonadetes bacterium]|nr:hypothetical protein [Gemmatimonadota bacterium]